MIVASCPTLSAGSAFLSTLLQHIDCQGQTIGAIGYQALADPGSPLSIALTALLTTFIALFGLRMVLGETPTLRDGVLAVVKIGVVLLIATSWPAYRTLVYDVIVHGPAQLSTAIGVPSGLPGANGDLVGHLQISDDAIARLTTLGSGRNDLSSVSATAGSGPVEPLERAPITDDLAFGSARVLFLSSILAAFAVVRLGAGVLLALAPLFAGLLLFDAARGLFVGWARALLFTMLSSVAVTIILGVELALLEPWLTQMLRLRYAKIVTPEAPVELLVMCLTFALALAGAIAMILRLSFAQQVPLGTNRIFGTQSVTDQSEPKNISVPPDTDRPARALGVANAVAAAQRREGASRAGTSSGRGLRPTTQPVASSQGGGVSLATSSQALRRRRPRKSIASALRDREL